MGGPSACPPTSSSSLLPKDNLSDSSKEVPQETSSSYELNRDLRVHLIQLTVKVNEIDAEVQQLKEEIGVERLKRDSLRSRMKKVQESTTVLQDEVYMLNQKISPTIGTNLSSSFALNGITGNAARMPVHPEVPGVITGNSVPEKRERSSREDSVPLTPLSRSRDGHSTRPSIEITNLRK